MVTKRDYYDVLGIERNASDDEIRKAFRKLAFQCHPDHNHEDGAAEKFKELNEAYEILSTPEKRAAYDRFGHIGTDGSFGQNFNGFDFGGFGDIFNSFFGGAASSRPGPEPGADLHFQVNITLEEAFSGTEKDLKISRVENCSVCSGNGCKPGTHASRCPVCGGTGQVRRVQQSLFGRFINVGTCSRCGGEGTVVTEPCDHCKGTGKERFTRNIVVEIPPGVDNGSQLRLAGEGESGTRGGPPGHVYILIGVSPHPRFRREGDDVLYEVPLNFAQAALGVELDVPSLSGNTRLKIPAGSQSGKIFRLKDKGIPHLNKSGKGDELVKIRIMTPEKLSREQKKLFEELANSFKDAKTA